MKAALLYLAAICLALAHADIVGQSVARVIDFATSHAPLLH